MVRLVVLAAALVLVSGCKDESDPVDIPFEGLEPGDVNKPKPTPEPEPEPTASASAPAPRATPGLSAIQSCCGALYARSRSAKDEGSKKVNRQAASVCSSVASKVAQGKMTKAQALAQVRSSLLGSPPAACR
jgi:hypothetical protein